MKSVINYNDVKGMLRNDSYRILSHYDSDKDLKINYENAIQFFKDQGMNVDYELNKLFGNNKNKLLSFEEIHNYLYSEFIRHIVDLDKRLLDRLSDKHDTHLIHLKELEDIVREDPICSPRLASLHLVLRSNGEFREGRYDTFKVPIKSLRIFCEDTIHNFENKPLPVIDVVGKSSN